MNFGAKVLYYRHIRKKNSPGTYANVRDMLTISIMHQHYFFSHPRIALFDSLFLWPQNNAESK